MEQLKKFSQIIEKAQQVSGVTVAVAAAADHEVLEAVSKADALGLARFILFGDEKEIRRLQQMHELTFAHVDIVHAATDRAACQAAVQTVSSGEADIVMKGMVSTADILRAALNKETGIRNGKRVLSHIVLFEVPHYDRLIYVTDTGMNLAPELKEKVQIVENAVELAHVLGNPEPKVAALTALEVVNPSMPATVDAAALAKMSERGQIKGCILDGPFALDNAVSKRAAEHKGIASPVAGEADVLLVDNIEAGNSLYKSLVYFAQSQMGGVILGGRAPIVLTSRADTSDAKLNSIALAVLYAAKK